MSRARVLLCALLVAIFSAPHVAGKVYDRCSFVEELQKNNINTQHVLSNWLCLVEAESGRDTSKVTPNKEISEYGIFQIKSPEWCTPKVAGGRCNMKCEDLVNENLADDVSCAQKVYKSRNSFSPWEGWKEKCRGKPLINISSCIKA